MIGDGVKAMAASGLSSCPDAAEHPKQNNAVSSADTIEARPFICPLQISWPRLGREAAGHMTGDQ
jgi:hypothetical protein